MPTPWFIFTDTVNLGFNLINVKAMPWLPLLLTNLAVCPGLLHILIFGKQEIEDDGAVSASLLPITKAPTTRYHLRCECLQCSVPVPVRDLWQNLPTVYSQQEHVSWLACSCLGWAWPDWHSFLQRLDKHQTSTLDSHMRYYRRYQTEFRF